MDTDKMDLLQSPLPELNLEHESKHFNFKVDCLRYGEWFSGSSLVMWSITYLALSIMLMIDMVYLFSS